MSEIGLGRGLDALMPDDSGEEGDLRELPVDRLEPNPDQPRQSIDPDRLEELTQSVRKQGVIEPILVSPPDKQGESFTIVAGERRWRAACQAGLERIPALIRQLTENEALAISLIENVQRENLTPLEEARAYRRLMDNQNWNQNQLAETLGKSRSAVANRLRLLKAPAPVQEALEEGRIHAGHARALLGLSDTETINELLYAILEHDLSVRQTESRIQRRNADEASKSGVSDDSSSPEAEATPRRFTRLESQLEEALGAPVTIESEDRNQGHIRIHFSNPDEFEMIKRRLQQLDIPST